MSDFTKSNHLPLVTQKSFNWCRVSYKGYDDVVQTLEQAVQKHGPPRFIRVDNGPKFISKDFDLWAYANKVTIDFSRPGKPTDNAFVESFNSRFRQECLNEHWFLSLEDARLKIVGWWREYNSHSSLGYKTPEEFANLRQKT
ncbi:MAG: integrase core domain-containing protein [Alphaproteobacteria bacterium]